MNPSFRVPSGSGLTNDGDKWFGTSPEIAGQGSRKRLVELGAKSDRRRCDATPNEHWIGHDSLKRLSVALDEEPASARSRRNSSNDSFGPNEEQIGLKRVSPQSRIF